MTAKEHLEWATERALEYFDADEHAGAIASFISDVGKHDGTAHIQRHEFTLMLLEDGYSRGRQAFRDSMLGFAVIEQGTPAG